jgi:hypothetical protein
MDNTVAALIAGAMGAIPGIASFWYSIHTRKQDSSKNSLDDVKEDLKIQKHIINEAHTPNISTLQADVKTLQNDYLNRMRILLENSMKS